MSGRRIPDTGALIMERRGEDESAVYGIAGMETASIEAQGRVPWLARRAVPDPHDAPHAPGQESPSVGCEGCERLRVERRAVRPEGGSTVPLVQDRAGFRIDDQDVASAADDNGSGAIRAIGDSHGFGGERERLVERPAGSPIPGPKPARMTARHVEKIVVRMLGYRRSQRDDPSTVGRERRSVEDSPDVEGGHHVACVHLMDVGNGRAMPQVGAEGKQELAVASHCHMVIITVNANGSCPRLRDLPDPNKSIALRSGDERAVG